jgi:phosphatidylglycerophosphatase A
MSPALRLLLAQLPNRMVIGLCTCGPVGRWSKAPGTNGSLLGLALYTVLFHQLGLLGQAMLALPLIGLAVLLCDEGERRLSQRDPGIIILDEVVAVPLCFIGLQAQMAASGGVWIYMLAGFALFRLFDILKPFGIGRLQRIPGGAGVVLDDLAAALAANVTLHIGLLLIALAGN